VADHVSDPYKQQVRMEFHILNLVIFREKMERQKIMNRMAARIP
jgi:hypothetical protein